MVIASLLSNRFSNHKYSSDGTDSIYDYSESDESNNERNSKRSRGKNIGFFSNQSSPSESTVLIENSEKETVCCFPCNLV